MGVFRSIVGVGQGAPHNWRGLRTLHRPAGPTSTAPQPAEVSLGQQQRHRQHFLWQKVPRLARVAWWRGGLVGGCECVVCDLLTTATVLPREFKKTSIASAINSGATPLRQPSD